MLFCELSNAHIVRKIEQGLRSWAGKLKWFPRQRRIASMRFGWLAFFFDERKWEFLLPTNNFRLAAKTMAAI
jgi:hypothetical protein